MSDRARLRTRARARARIAAHPLQRFHEEVLRVAVLALKHVADRLAVEQLDRHGVLLRQLLVDEERLGVLFGALRVPEIGEDAAEEGGGAGATMRTSVADCVAGLPWSRRLGHRTR